jgi:hypothetical protein
MEQVPQPYGGLNLQAELKWAEAYYVSLRKIIGVRSTLISNQSG